MLLLATADATLTGSIIGAAVLIFLAIVGQTFYYGRLTQQVRELRTDVNDLTSSYKDLTERVISMAIELAKIVALGTFAHNKKEDN